MLNRWEIYYIESFKDHNDEWDIDSVKYSNEDCFIPDYPSQLRIINALIEAGFLDKTVNENNVEAIQEENDRIVIYSVEEGFMPFLMLELA